MDCSHLRGVRYWIFKVLGGGLGGGLEGSVLDMRRYDRRALTKDRAA